MSLSTTGGGSLHRRKKSLSKLSLNRIHRKRKCYVMLVVEKTSYDLEKLLMIRYHTESEPNNEVKFISLNDIYDFIISYEIKELYIDKAIKVKLRNCCDEARHYLKQGRSLPNDLLAKIIKLRIITLITNDLHQHKHPKVYDDDFLDNDICYLNPRKRCKRKLRKIKFRQLYVILIQFYSPDIIPACCQYHLSISAIIEFGQKDDGSLKCFLEDTHNRQSDIFREEFWKKAPTLYYRHHLGEPYRLVYNPLNFPISKDNPKLYSEQCRQLYEEFIDSIDIEKIRIMKDVIIHRFGFHEMLTAEIDKENYCSESDNEEVATNYNSVPSVSSGSSWNDSKNVPSTISNGDTKPSASSDTGWEDSRPLVRRVAPEMDIDCRKRFTKWPGGKIEN